LPASIAATTPGGAPGGGIALPVFRITFALPTLPVGAPVGADGCPAGAPGAAEPPVWAIALEAPADNVSASSPAIAHLIPADAFTRKPTSFSGLRG